MKARISKVPCHKCLKEGAIVELDKYSGETYGWLVHGKNKDGFLVYEYFTEDLFEIIKEP